MGNPQTKEWLYSVPTNNADKQTGESFVYRHPDSVGKDLFAMDVGGQTVQDFLRLRFDPKHAAKLCFGRRAVKDGKPDGGFVFKTNAQAKFEAESFGSGLLNLSLCPEVAEYRDYRLNMIGILSKNTMEYLINELACCFYGITIVPIYDTLGEEAVVFCMNETKLAACIVHPDRFEFLFKLKKAGKLPFLKTIVVSDAAALKPEQRALKAEDLRVLDFAEVQEAGRANVREWAKVTPESIWAFSYTSGTTGNPKGVLIDHRNALSTFLLVDQVVAQTEANNDIIYLSYLPMAHVLERVVFINVLRKHGVIGVFSGNAREIMDDLKVLNPTIMVSVPRILIKIYEGINKKVASMPVFMQNLFKNAVHSKLLNLHTTGSLKSTIYDRLLFAKVRSQLGDRMKFILTGSAPIEKHIVDFLKVCFSCPIIEGYGQTEASGIEIVNRPVDSEAGHIGGPSHTLEFKLVDAPEYKYFHTDVDDLGNPTPRGEIWVRGPGVSPGYYKNDEKNKETFTADGWLQSGDIGMLTPYRNCLKIIDRKKNLFKLQQGEYISPEKLENGYKEASDLIDEIFVYGDGHHTFLVAVISVAPAHLSKLAAQAGAASTDPAAAAKDPVVKQYIIKLFDGMAAKKKFNSLEKIKGLIIETRSFTDLGVMTSSLKLKRPDAGKVFKAQIMEIYKNTASE